MGARIGYSHAPVSSLARPGQAGETPLRGWMTRRLLDVGIHAGLLGFGRGVGDDTDPRFERLATLCAVTRGAVMGSVFGAGGSDRCVILIARGIGVDVLPHPSTLPAGGRADEMPSAVAGPTHRKLRGRPIQRPKA